MSASLPNDTPPNDSLPLVLAGPLLRRAEPERLVFWLATSCPTTIELILASEGEAERRIRLAEGTHSAIRIGTHAWLHLLDVALDPPLPCARLVDYDLRLTADGREPAGIAEWAPHLLYPGRQRASLVLKPRLDQLLHGSCRKPHHPAADSLLQVDRLLEENLLQAESRPALLMMSGDQVYADDVAGPMLVAIHGLIRRLGLYGEHLEGALVDDSEALYAHPATYYRREDLLPAFKSNEALRERFFGGVKKPIFTSANAHNHLVGLAEVLAMYLLVWSPAPWRLVRLEPPPGLDARHAQRFADERRHIEAFRDGLPGVARALAHISSLMIFDDHDITDDWNLSARWELTAYGHPFSRRIIGNALLAYLLCQGWGNDPQHCGEWLAPVTALMEGAAADGRLPCAEQDRLLDALLDFQHWHYRLPGSPTLIVLDTRTRRWRSERNLGRPSGLMDWEALSELQQDLLGEKAAIIVSPAPMFGVKLIEGVQKLFSWIGQPLLVDAENWMAHRGAASVMMNIFRHSRTPGNYLILSGDVHYSFVYDIRIRHRERGPRLWQITSSGDQERIPATPAGLVRPPQPLALCALVAAELADPAAQPGNPPARSAAQPGRRAPVEQRRDRPGIHWRGRSSARGVAGQCRWLAGDRLRATSRRRRRTSGPVAGRAGSLRRQNKGDGRTPRRVIRPPGFRTAAPARPGSPPALARAPRRRPAGRRRTGTPAWPLHRSTRCATATGRRPRPPGAVRSAGNRVRPGPPAPALAGAGRGGATGRCGREC
ncbi:isoleucyl-tRNA synthetase [Pseudomonas aeruginosa]|nr:isoleucyl-tRNA synthetase [Pseudomonas aeruginosa]